MNATANNQLTTLEATHRQLEHELRALNRRGRLTPSEEMRCRVLKKEKLIAKDKIRFLMGDVRMAR